MQCQVCDEMEQARITFVSSFDIFKISYAYRLVLMLGSRV